jgi:chromosome segregation ATPase
MKRQVEKTGLKCKMVEEEMDKLTLKADKLAKENKKLEGELENQKGFKMNKEKELQELKNDLEKQKRDLDAKAVALDQNADIQKLSQRLMMNRQEMKDRLLTDIKKSNSVLDFLNKDNNEQEVFMNQSMANLGWDDTKNYMVMNEKFKGLVELLKNKLENLQKEKERMDKKSQKYKNNNKELKEKLENVKNEVQMMETTNTLKEDRITKLKDEIQELKSSNKAMAQEIEESLSKRPVSARVRNFGEGDPTRSSDMMGGTRNNFHPRMDEDLRKLESEVSVLKDMVNKRDFKIEQLKDVIKNNEMVYEKSIEEHNMMYNQKMQDHQNLLERLKEMADASQSFHEMIREVSEENLELKDKIAMEIRKRKRIVKSLKTEIQELKVQIRGLGQLFRQMDHIKSQLNIVEVDELEESDEDEMEDPKDNEYDEYDDEHEEDENDEDYEEEDENEDMEDEEDNDDEITNSRLFRKRQNKR